MNREGTIKEFIQDLYSKKFIVTCRYCGKELQPGLMNEAHHWTECPKNPRLIKILIHRSPLIDRINETIEIVKAKRKAGPPAKNPKD